MDFLPHFEELRRRLFICLMTLAAASVGAYFFSENILHVLTQPLRQYSNEALFFQKPFEAFVIHIKAAVFCGFIFSSPVLFFQLWLFVAPGLYEKEKKVLLPVIFISIGLFFIGILFAYFLVIPWGLHFMLSFQTESLKPMLNAGAYFSFLIGMMMAFGALFNFPVIVAGLVELGTVSTKTLAASRKPIIVSIFIASAILTPSPDPVSQVFLALPLWALFEISLLFAGHRENRRKAAKGSVDTPLSEVL